MKINLESTVATNWIIGIGGNDLDNVIIKRVYGTARQAAEFVMQIVETDKRADKDSWDYGTECAEEMEITESRIYAYNVFNHYHIDYVAVPEPPVIKLPV